MARPSGRKADRPSPIEALAITMAWFASARRGLNSVAWRIEQDDEGAVIIVTAGDAPGLCITPGDGGFTLLARAADGEDHESGPYASLDAALRAGARVLREHEGGEVMGPVGHG